MTLRRLILTQIFLWTRLVLDEFYEALEKCRYRALQQTLCSPEEWIFTYGPPLPLSCGELGLTSTLLTVTLDSRKSGKEESPE